MAQDLIVSEQSFEGYRKQQIGGLISSEICGLLVHTNTIEEFQAFDMDQLIQQESAKRRPDSPNRFLIVVFGDLKNYKFSMKSVLLEQSTRHIQQRKANKLSAFLSAEQIEQMSQVVSARLLRDNVEVEPQEFILGIDSSSGHFSLLEDGSPVPDGGYLCFLDSSPKLPSSLIANHVADRVKNFTSPDQVLNVLLIRAKCSKLSPKVPLDGAL